MLLAALLIPVALWLPATHVGKALMTGSVLLVIIVELLNSAIEAAVDRISLDRHYLAKRAKDIGSAAVLASLANVAVVWGLVLTALLRRKNWHPGDGPPQYPNVTRIFPQKLQRGFINPSRKIH